MLPLEVFGFGGPFSIKQWVLSTHVHMSLMFLICGASGKCTVLLRNSANPCKERWQPAISGCFTLSPAKEMIVMYGVVRIARSCATPE